MMIRQTLLWYLSGISDHTHFLIYLQHECLYSEHLLTGELDEYQCLLSQFVQPSTVHPTTILKNSPELPGHLKQILCGVSMSRVNESLFGVSRSHDQADCHTHIW